MSFPSNERIRLASLNGPATAFPPLFLLEESCRRGGDLEGLLSAGLENKSP